MRYTVPLLLAVLTAFALANPTSPERESRALGYLPNEVTVDAYRSAVAAVDSADLTHATVLALPKLPVRGNSVVILHGRFSASGQSCTVRVVSYFSGQGRLLNRSTGTYTTGEVADVILGFQEKTLVASSATDGTDYLSATTFADTLGATHIRIVVVTAPGSGNVDIHAVGQ